MVWLNQQAHRAGLAGRFLNQTVALKRLNHLVNRWCRNAEVALKIGFRRGLVVDLRIVINESQVLTLFGRELGRDGGISPGNGFNNHTEDAIRGNRNLHFDDADLPPIPNGEASVRSP